MTDYTTPQMIEHLNDRKKVFIARETKQSQVYGLFIEVLVQLKEALKSFDNKIINGRIETKLNKDLSQDGRVTFSLCREWPYYEVTIGLYNMSDRTYKCDAKHEGNGYISYYECKFNLRFREADVISNGNRLDYEKTCKEIDRAIERCKNIIGEIQDCIDNIDKYINNGIEIEKQVSEYVKNTPWMLRKQFTSYSWGAF